jgi:hypothetical protein
VFLYGVSFVLRKSAAPVVTVGNALCKQFAFRPLIYTASAGV